jgi:hypothetical protein
MARAQLLSVAVDYPPLYVTANGRRKLGGNTMRLPSFMVLGAGKAGTTSLYYYLAQHPEVFMCSPKEPPFFQTEYELGAEYYWRTHFRGYRGQRHAGEAAHHNLHLPYVTERIAATVPDASFIVLCRNPIERALSAYWHNVTRGVERSSFRGRHREESATAGDGPVVQ